ncbi:MAG: rubrerythrin-like domain-containing protein [Halobacteriaceae archaeon]
MVLECTDCGHRTESDVSVGPCSVCGGPTQNLSVARD